MKRISIVLLVLCISYSANAEPGKITKVLATKADISIAILEKDGSFTVYIHNYKTGKAILHNISRYRRFIMDAYLCLDKKQIPQTIIVKRIKKTGESHLQFFVRADPLHKYFFEIADKNTKEFYKTYKVNELIKKYKPK